MNNEQLNGREKYYQKEIDKLRKERGNREKKWATVQAKLKEAEALEAEGKLQLRDAGTGVGAGQAECDSKRNIERAYHEVTKLLGPDNGSGDWDEGLKKLRKLTGEPEPEPELKPEPEPEPEPEAEADLKSN